MPGLGLSIPDVAVRGRGYDMRAALGAALLGYWDAEHTDLVTQSGGLVSSWKDAIAGYDMVQATGSAKPTWQAAGLNGRPAVVGDGIDDCLALASQPFPSGASPCEVWVLGTQAALVADATTRTVLAYGDITNTSRAMRRQVNSGRNEIFALSGTGSSSAGAADAGDGSGAFVGRAEFLATSLAFTRNGGTRVSAATVPATATARARLLASAASGAGTFWQGAISVALVTQALTSDQAAALLAHLKSRGGIA